MENSSFKWSSLQGARHINHLCSQVAVIPSAIVTAARTGSMTGILRAVSNCRRRGENPAHPRMIDCAPRAMSLFPASIVSRYSSSPPSDKTESLSLVEFYSGVDTSRLFDCVWPPGSCGYQDRYFELTFESPKIHPKGLECEFI